jgi:glycosyltransferase involved in cell wall biosynthesis
MKKGELPQDPLRILQVSTADIWGGAERVAWSLFNAYRTRGHTSWLAVGKKHSDHPDVRLIPNEDALGAWARLWFSRSARMRAGSSRTVGALGRVAGALGDPARSLDYHLGREDFRFRGTGRLLALTQERPDLVHAHNLHGDYFDLRVLPRLSAQLPLVLTLHDGWLLSGHCAHSFECERWRIGCGRCPDLSIYPAIKRDATAHNLRRKRRIFSRSRLNVATPSRWLMNKVTQSVLADHVREARVIPNGVDLSVFCPGDRQAARAELGLPREGPLLLTTGVHLRENRWKDFQTLRDAVTRLGSESGRSHPHVVVLGTAESSSDNGRAQMHFVTHVRDPLTVAKYFQAADVYVHPARADTFPVAVLEALACGTPVVASAVGGIPEQVEDERTGYLTPIGDPAALAARVARLLDDERLRARLGDEAVRQARRQFDFERQVSAYLDWYHELVDEAASRTSS